MALIENMGFETGCTPHGNFEDDIHSDHCDQQLGKSLVLSISFLS